MTEREKMIKVLRDNIEYEIQYYPDDNYAEVVFDYNVIADALIKAGIRDITQEGYICMSGEVIIPTPNIYNKVADLLDCPKMKE